MPFLSLLRIHSIINAGWDYKIIICHSTQICIHWWFRYYIFLHTIFTIHFALLSSYDKIAKGTRVYNEDKTLNKINNTRGFMTKSHFCLLTLSFAVILTKTDSILCCVPWDEKWLVKTHTQSKFLSTCHKTVQVCKPVLYVYTALYM